MPPGAPAPAVAASDEAKNLLSQINDESVRAQTAVTSKDIDRAKDSKDRQDTLGQQLTTLQDQVAKNPALSAAAPTVKGLLDEATTTKTSTTKTVDDAVSTSGCDGSGPLCLFGGALVGSYSLTLGSGDRSGQTGHHIISLLVPEGGLRWAVRSHISIDAALYTAIISPEFQPNAISTVGSGCSVAPNKFNDMLPCEGNTALRPYGALLLGVTIGTGSSSLGVVTAGYTIGIARTTQDANAFFFQGVMIGTAGVYKTVSVKK